MIIAVDGHYEGTRAQVAGGLFHRWDDEHIAVATATNIEIPAEYVSGEFYKRELPCILAVLDIIVDSVTTIVIDGYVWLGPDHPGLGYYLWEALDQKIPVVGVAKTKFKDSTGEEVFRGKSKRPLYVTAAGMSQEKAAQFVQSMAGPYRLPTLLKVVDRMARGDDPLIIGSRSSMDRARASEARNAGSSPAENSSHLTP